MGKNYSRALWGGGIMRSIYIKFEFVDVNIFMDDEESIRNGVKK